MIAFLKGLLIGGFLFLPTVAYAGGYGRGYCATCAPAPYVAPYVSKQVNVQYANAFVTFVPSQVLLNGQVVTYGNYGTSGSIGYSYQGATVAPQLPLQGAPQQTQPQPGSVEDRLSRIEEVLAQLAGGGQPTEGGQDPAHDMNGPEAILKRHCGKCHSAGGSGFFSLPLFQQNGNLLQSLPRLDIYESISKKPDEAGYMPKGNNPLSASEKEVIRVWVQQGLKGHSY